MQVYGGGAEFPRDRDVGDHHLHVEIASKQINHFPRLSAAVHHCPTSPAYPWRLPRPISDQSGALHGRERRFSKAAVGRRASRQRAAHRAGAYSRGRGRRAAPLDSRGRDRGRETGAEAQRGRIERPSGRSLERKRRCKGEQTAADGRRRTQASRVDEGEGCVDRRGELSAEEPPGHRAGRARCPSEQTASASEGSVWYEQSECLKRGPVSGSWTWDATEEHNSIS